MKRCVRSFPQGRWIGVACFLTVCSLVACSDSGSGSPGDSTTIDGSTPDASANNDVSLSDSSIGDGSDPDDSGGTTNGSTNDAGSDAEVPTEPPLTPSLLTASAGSASVSLVWDAAAGASSYVVRRAKLTGDFQPIDTIAFDELATTGATQFNDDTAQVGADYIYTVSASNALGESEPSNYSCGTAAPAGAEVIGVRPRVFMAIHGSQPLSTGTPEELKEWGMVRTCMEGFYGNRAGVSPEDQLGIVNAVNARSYAGINNANSAAEQPNPMISGPTLTRIENSGIVLNREFNVIYTNNVELWDKVSMDDLRTTFTASPDADPAALFQDVYIGYALKNWVDAADVGGARSLPGAIEAFDKAGGSMVECIGGLCGSNGEFGQGFMDLVTRTHAAGKPMMVFVSKGGQGIRLGWINELQTMYANVAKAGGWRRDDVVMVINYNGFYPVLPMTETDGEPADTVTGMLSWSLRQ